MRIWSFHPKYLDAKGIVALWRESLLAQNVLLSKTKGYKNHPQLDRFKQQSSPVQILVNYLHIICDEAHRRSYKFNRRKLAGSAKPFQPIKVTDKQINYEWQHFLTKIEIRDYQRFKKLQNLSAPEPHPLFTIVAGEIESWERLTSTDL